MRGIQIAGHGRGSGPHGAQCDFERIMRRPFVWRRMRLLGFRIGCVCVHRELDQNFVYTQFWIDARVNSRKPPLFKWRSTHFSPETYFDSTRIFMRRASMGRLNILILLPPIKRAALARGINMIASLISCLLSPLALWTRACAFFRHYKERVRAFL